MSNTKSSSSGCFSEVLRRILCAGSPQTHRSDHIMEFKTDDDDHVENKVQIQASSESGPGIVARLMGLDSLPENNWVQKGKIPGPVMRSRSVNFVDYMLEFDLTQAKHRRVKTSASFREVPQLLQQHNKKNHEYLFVYLDNVDQNSEVAGFKTRKSEKGDGSSSKHAQQIKEIKLAACKNQSQEKNKKISKLKNEPIRRVSSGNRSLKAGSCINTGTKNVKIKGGDGASSKRKTLLKEEVSGVTRKKKSNSGSNPVSVNNLAARQENAISEDYSGNLEVKSEKKLGLSKSVKYESPTMDASVRISISEGLGKLESTKKKNFMSTDIEETESNYMELVCKPCKLAEEDVKFSNFIITNKFFTFQDFEEICAEFGEQILDLMLDQVADELGGFHHHMQISVPCHACRKLGRHFVQK